MKPLFGRGAACFIITLIFFSIATAQTKQTLRLETFIENVKRFHPVAKQAQLVGEAASANLMEARGGFDPMLQLNQEQKTFDDTQYFQYNNSELKVTGPFGAEFKTGIENTTGKYTNPELTRGVISYVGVEIPVVSGLLMDKRRAVLRQAKIYMNQSAEEQKIMINQLLFDAHIAYLNWAAALQLSEIYGSYVDVAFKRMQLMRIAFANGDRSAADTVEAFTQFLNYKLLDAEATLAANNRMVGLSEFLWDESQNPYLLPAGYVPDISELEQLQPLQALDEVLGKVPTLHPEVKVYEYKLDGLEIERKLKFQYLLPKVNLRAGILSQDYYQYEGFPPGYIEGNNKFGLNVKIPLLLRQERGNYRKVKLKIKDNELSMSQKILALQNKIRQYHNEVNALRGQIKMMEDLYEKVAFLLRSEQLKFSQGESSMFLLNARESKTLEAQQKIVELKLKHSKAVYSIKWATATIE